MTLNRWDPFRDLLNFQEKMTRLMDAAFDEGVPSRPASWKPIVDILETSDAYVLRADLPGVGKDAINIEVHGDRLTIQGERRIPLDPRDAAYHSIERESGLFERHFSLPGNVDVEKARATYEDGVLELVLPKSREVHQKNIAVVYVG